MADKSALDGLRPQKVFGFFEELCRIPHGSLNVEQMGLYLKDFADRRGLFAIRDEYGNVIIKKPGTFGLEGAEPVIIQGHMDMVAVCAEGVRKDLLTEGIEPACDGEYVYAKGTSLGGDDGIAVAYGLALLDADDIAHPPLEVVITADEEIGMLGASALDMSLLSGKRMINIDSEEEGIFTVSCAGGLTAVMDIPCARKMERAKAVHVRLNGLLGGHSGTEIIRDRANAIRQLGRMLFACRSLCRPADFRGGEKDNVIPSAAEALVAVAEDMTENFCLRMTETFETIKKEYPLEAAGMKLDMEVAEETEEISVLDDGSRAVLFALLLNFPSGIVRMEDSHNDMVRTSLNMAVVRTEEEKLHAASLIRSSVQSEKYFIFDRLSAMAEAFGGRVQGSGDYSGWEYRQDSQLSQIMSAVYKRMFGKEPVIEGIHAGLECGIFASAIPGLDCVSIGPDMEDIHTAKEKLSVASVQRTWDFLLELLKELGKR